jgi:arginine N-succinyltransferase
LTVRYAIRSAQPGDEARLLELARHLDSVNLPNDPAEIERIVDHAERSFSGAVKDPRKREYVFVLDDRSAGRLAGTSLIIAQLGRRDAPFISLAVRKEEKYSVTTDIHIEHTLLRIVFNYDGPTEIGGLIMHPDYRHAPERLGMLISYVRFLFMALRLDDFRSEVVAELLPPLEPDGRSLLWEALGKHFTGMSYQDADKLSKKNKEFIKALWPHQDIYASLLPPEAQAVIGRVGAQTVGVEKMLRRIGFRWDERVDPFDGGPHFRAELREVTLVRKSVRARVAGLLATADSEGIQSDDRRSQRALVSIERASRPYFQATSMHLHTEGAQCWLPSDEAQALGIEPGDSVGLLPLD